MNIIGLVGSSRRGNTFTMTNAACDVLRGKCCLQLIHLHEKTIQPCDGCLSCDKTGLCHIKDGMADILPSIADADAFIFATPARWGLLSGELKVFFDRLNPFAAQEGLKGKKALIFVAGQSSQKHGTSLKLARDSVFNFCESAGIDVVESVLAYDCLEPTDIADKAPAALKQCKTAAHKLLDAFR